MLFNTWKVSLMLWSINILNPTFFPMSKNKIISFSLNLQIKIFKIFFKQSLQKESRFRMPFYLPVTQNSKKYGKFVNKLQYLQEIRVKILPTISVLMLRNG